MLRMSGFDSGPDVNPRYLLQMWELVLGNRYFDNPAVPYHSDTVHLAHIEEKIGLFPDSLLNISNSRDKFFDSQGIALCFFDVKGSPF